KLLQRRRTLTEEEILRLLSPILGALEAIHQAGFIHRDIKPGNIFIGNDGSPILLDFGAARAAVQEHALTLTTFASPGYAPIEQYTSNSDRQGPWTDIYGLGATLYKAVTGAPPLAAVDRSESLTQDQRDYYVPSARAAEGSYSQSLLRAIDHALQFHAAERPETVAAWRAELGLTAPPDVLVAEPAGTDTAPTVLLPPREPPISQKVTTATEHRRHLGLLTGGSLLGVLAGLLGTALLIGDPKPDTTSDGTSLSAPDLASGAPPPEAPAELTGNRAAAPESAFQTTAAVPMNSDGSATTGSLPPIGAPVGMPGGVVTAEALVPPSSVQPIPTSIPQAEATTAPDSIEELLAAADEDLTALRLTSPAHDNAYEKYQRVLALDPVNPRARQGVSAVAEKYVRLFYRDLEANRLQRARAYLAKAEAVTPGAENVTEARATLEARLAAVDAARAPPPEEPREDGGAFVRMREFFTIRAPDTSQRDLTRAEQLRRRLGGGL
ncbi:MAG: protein kinase domain-containing protein, partial [Chromatiales bacterium]